MTMGDNIEQALEDRRLIERSIAGDDSAYEELIDSYQNLVWELLNRMVPGMEDREELAQDVFLKAYFNLKRFRFDSKFSTWLYTIAYRTALSHLRKHKLEMVDVEAVPETEALGDGSDTQVLAQELHRAIEALGLDDRTVITLFHLHNCTVEEISIIVGKPEGTIKNQLFRARQKLKTKLEVSTRSKTKKGAL